MESIDATVKDDGLLYSNSTPPTKMCRWLVSTQLFLTRIVGYGVDVDVVMDRIVIIVLLFFIFAFNLSTDSQFGIRLRFLLIKSFHDYYFFVKQQTHW